MEQTAGINLIPGNDAERVEALNRYRIFNTSSEQAFNNIAELAKTIFKSPIAHVSFLNAEQEFIKASIGLSNLVLVDRKDSICALAILDSGTTVFEDTLEEPLLATNPFVHGPENMRFYAGSPLITPDGFIIGTMCIVDTTPRTFSAYEKEVLQGLAKVAMEQTELRLATIRETEKQKAINEKLAASEQRLQGILDTMAEGVGIIDTDGQLTYANPMAQKILGLKESAIKERTFDDSKWQNLRIDGSPLPEADHPMAVMLNTGLAVYDCEIAVQPPDKERFYISINAAPIIDSDGKITGGIGTFMDVTNRRKLLQQKEEFISIASHELKTPVTSLKASMQILNRMKNNPSPVMLSKLIDQSNRSLYKLSSLINDLLNTNRISQGQLQLRKTNFTIANMINDCCHHIRTTGTHAITLKGDIALQICADEHQIDQVVVNIVNNAVKYAPDSKEICINIEKLEKFAKISVKDSGPGIPNDKLPHLFDRYYRADYSGIQFSGLGLGLYICAEIIKKHGTEIGVESKPGKGSTFWFTLPLS
ncbi:ATP-binding protein [Mucilaginibacter arboris]|uniref:histidine kinase n=1 Tax=Mucilaginibacter arboris TaxID=2682090 RepID=A0A7K1T178_9SPHI|nr:ATP-binding protein [Mucilaginibacter arboris]MVN23050.1 PAS domain-containing protein [Mucilaginibacter arboris]